jgi:putative spermidine/putrescine transport system ATP-binding protein
MVFQHYALFPHMTVAENVSFPLRRRKMKRGEVRERIAEVLELVRLVGFEDRYPRQLSGGQQQRVAVARAIAFRPRLLLMDEPLGALDKNLREALQLEIKRIHQEVRSTFVYVTHDQEEAMALSDRIAIFNHGRIEQVGTPQELYENPATLFVASFLGETNATSGVLTEEGTITTVDGALTLRANHDSGLPAGTLVTVVLRPEHCAIRMPASRLREDENALTGVVRQVLYLGSARRVAVEVQPNHSIVVRESAHRPLLGAEGQQVLVTWDAKDAVVLRADGTRLIADDKERRELAVDGAIGDS